MMHSFCRILYSCEKRMNQYYICYGLVSKTRQRLMFIKQSHLWTKKNEMSFCICGFLHAL